MNRSPTEYALLVLTMLWAPLALGQSDDWYVSGSLVYTDGAKEREVDDGLTGAQATAGYNFNDYLSIEGLLGYSVLEGFCRPGDCYTDQDILEISADLLAFYDRDATFAPYLLAGVGYLIVNSDEGPPYFFSIGNNAATASAGAGLKWRISQSKYSMRLEYRARFAFDDTTMTDQLIALGLQYDFGGRKSSVPVPDTNVDTDGDGVLDMWDACPGTPPGTEVTSRGCELKNIDRDSDGDRVFDSQDQCPNTPTGAAVDPRGCPLDSDMDGVPTGQDRCPGSRIGAEVDEYGCELDLDEDGVPDAQDQCPNSSRGAQVDMYGCQFRDIISLPGVNFETGFDILLPGTEYILEGAAVTLNKYPDLKVEVAGYTDNVGGAEANLSLSERRAKTVRDFLIKYGVAADRLTYKGYGEANPIASNDSAEGRALNRRVELRIVSR